MPSNPSLIAEMVARRASELTGVDVAEIQRELSVGSQPSGGALVRFTGPSSQVREAVEQAISELKL